jgi:tetratricopeptide (TPR) repeat protein
MLTNKALRMTWLLALVASPAWAGVMDREPTLGDIWFLAAGVAVLGLVVTWAWPPLALLSLPITWHVAGYLLDGVRDPDRRAAILDSAGPGYILGAYAAVALMLLGHAAGISLYIRRRKLGPGQRRRFRPGCVAASVALLLCAYSIAESPAFEKAAEAGGRRAYASGDYDTAIRLLRRAEFLGHRASRSLALCYYRLGEYSIAENQLARPVEYPDDLIVLGAIQLAQMRDAEAERSFRSVLERRTGRAYHTNALASHNLSILYRRRGDEQRANRYAREALKWSRGASSRWSGPQPDWPQATTHHP